jgi:hypothetical protein
MPKKMNKEVPTNDWITIDRDPHAIKATQLRVQLQRKHQRRMKFTANKVSNDAATTTYNSKIVTNITAISSDGYPICGLVPTKSSSVPTAADTAFSITGKK